ncbi:MAG: hypothetical protein ISS19_10610 [Bacteroidales bacterium]|nr:hypothetical protein [Bacteroidales bacterium]
MLESTRVVISAARERMSGVVKKSIEVPVDGFDLFLTADKLVAGHRFPGSDQCFRMRHRV